MESSLRRHRGELEAAWQTGVALDALDRASLRPEVAESWRRSASTVAPAIDCAPVDDPAEVAGRWAASPLGRASRVIIDDLADLAADGDLVAALTDEQVRIAWLAGGTTMRRRAETVHFCVGGRWGEEAVGTNALALAERTGRASTVFSAEHFAAMVHDWVCYSAPVIDPHSGRVAGVVDVSTVWDKASPALRTTVGALARCVEYELERIGPVEAGPGAGVVLRTLGAARCWVDGQRVAVTPRQLELLTVLSLHPDGLTLDELTGLVYGDHSVAASTVKAELSRLRHLLGGRVGSRPYRLLGPVTTDHGDCLEGLRAGSVPAALAAYGGTMLPASESPEIRSWRDHIDVAVRHAAVESGDAAALVRLGGLRRDDVEVQRAALDALPPGDHRRSFVAGSLYVAASD